VEIGVESPYVFSCSTEKSGLEQPMPEGTMNKNFSFLIPSSGKNACTGRKENRIVAAAGAPAQLFLSVLENLFFSERPVARRRCAHGRSP